ncbi:MAG: chromate efflux transporter [Deltaproteobacteria bacterium]|nr:chromate efflux transporter [Deltaproteobacteria bacterium]
MKAPTLWEISASFLHLGISAYGGLAMIEPVRRRVVEEKGWLSQAEFLEGLALCQMAPGATVVQLAAYAGYRLRRLPGALAAAAGFILPAFFLMLGLSFAYFRFGNLSWVQAVSRGLGALVIALLLQTTWRLGRTICQRWPDLLITLLALMAFWGRLSYFLVFLAAGLTRLGLQWQFFPEAPAIEKMALGRKSGWVRPGLQALAAVLAGAVFILGLGRQDELLARLAWIFAKIGIISFGGGYVMIPILQWEVVEHLGWLNLRQFLDGILLSYATPGPLIILAAFVGYAVKGFWGALITTVSVFLPPIMIIVCLFDPYRNLKESRWLRPLLQGILAALVGMLAMVTLQMGWASLKDGKDLVLLAGAAAALMICKIDLPWVAAALAGISLLIF